MGLLRKRRAKNAHALQVPPTMRFVMDGVMPEWLQAKDLILQIIGEITVAGTSWFFRVFS